MSNLSKGKYAQFISDRSGQAFPYQEMVIEWNGSRVHVSEFEAKHPQLEPKPTTADGQGLRNARPQIFTQASGDGGFINVDLTLPGDFAFNSNNGMVPEDGSVANNKRQALVSLGNVDITGDLATVFTVTVADAGGNKYFIDGAQQATLNLTKGQTYQFDQSAGSNETHPLRLSTTSDGTHNSGTEYTTGVTTNGVPGNSGAYTQIVVDASAPSTLYYYCSSHSGMGGQINIS
jgi:hypothetical protein